MPTLKGVFSYVKNFLRDRDVAAVAPSSQFLVRRVCKWIDFDEPAVIVEYGPGNGVFSEYIWERMTDDSVLLLIENNPDFVDLLVQRTAEDARVIVEEARAENVARLLEQHGLDGADYVVSGIPFSFLEEDAKHDLLSQTREVLTDGGTFLVYQNYNHLEEPLREHFSEVTKEFEPRNIPPTMFAYEAVK